MATENIYAVQDPTKQYPGPPFKEQQQDAQGHQHFGVAAYAGK